MPLWYPKSRRYFGYLHNFQRMDAAAANPPPPPTSIHITANTNHDHAIVAAALTFTHHYHPLIQTFVKDDDVTCGSSTPPPLLQHKIDCCVPSHPPSSLLLPSKMDVDDPTDALLAGLINAKHIIDEAVKDYYNENARVDSAVIVVLNDNSDIPPFEHDVPSVPCCSGNKRSFPLFPQKPTLIAFVCVVEEESWFQAQAHDDVRTGKMREPT
jgi:hypothetical protein